MPQQVQQHIHCSVNNCNYWADGNMCHASEIMVTSDDNANRLPDKIDAPMAAQVTPSPVSSATDSCCKTFVPKGSDKINVDGVMKK